MNIIKNAFFMSLSDTKARYKFSVIGPFWPMLSNVFGVLCLGLIWGHLLKQDMNTFIPQLTVGLIIWQLISGVLSDSSTVFVRYGAVIRNVDMPSCFFSVRILSKHLINLAHNLVIIVGVMWYYNVPLTSNLWLVLPGLLLVTLNLYWLLHGLGLAGARFRDIEPIINSLLPLLFFVSPVLYRADNFPAALNILLLNPFSYMIEVIRIPILGGSIPILTWVVLVGMLVVGGTLTWYCQQKQGKNLAFWI